MNFDRLRRIETALNVNQFCPGCCPHVTWHQEIVADDGSVTYNPPLVPTPECTCRPKRTADVITGFILARQRPRPDIDIDTDTEMEAEGLS